MKFYFSSYSATSLIIYFWCKIPLQDCLGEPSDAGKEEFGCLLHGIPGTDQNGKIDANDKEMAMDGPEEFAGISALPIPERY